MWRPIDPVGRLLLWLVLLLTGAGCSGGRSTYDPEGDTQTVSIQHLKTLYRNYPLTITEPIGIVGMVISNDRYGNFAYSLVIEDPTGGIEIKLAQRDLFKHFPAGQQVVVRCAGLVLGAYGGTLQLGGVSSDGRYEVGLLAPGDIAAHLIVQGQPVIEPAYTTLDRSQLSDRWVNCQVVLRDVQFADDQLGLTWGDAGGWARRTLHWCDGSRIEVETAPDALFAAYPLPQGRGIIGGILKKFNRTYSLVPIDDSRQNMTGPRCPAP